MFLSRDVAAARSVIALIGGVYVVLAAGLVYEQSATNPPVRATPMEVVLLIGPGLVLLYGGYRLTKTDIRPEFHPTIALWCLGGFGIMVALLALYHL